MIPELETRVTMLARLIGSKWYGSLHELSVRAGVPYMWCIGVVKGREIPKEQAERLTRFLDSL